MKLTGLVRFTLAALGLLGAVSAGVASKPVMVHYLPWHVAKPFSPDWGWHWTMSHFDPDTLTASGQRQIASWYYPLIGPYDSADPVVLEYHVLLMKLAGIDGVIADWYGADDYLDYSLINQRTAALFKLTRRAGLKFSLCYEDRTIQQEINGGYLAASNAIAHARLTLLHVETNYFADSSFLTWGNQPVLLNFGPQYFKTDAQWRTIFSALNPTNQPAFFTEDTRLPVGAGAFNWPPMWLSQASAGVLSSDALAGYLARFEQDARSWPAFVSSAFPRFHDIYAEAGVGSSYGFLADNGGDTLRATLSRAMTNASSIVQIVTWNDFGEGTMIEPTREYGYRDLGILQDLRRQHLDANFPLRTNDLSLATRLYSLRRQHAGNEIVGAELDRAFTSIILTNLALASLQLTAVESSRPLIYNLSTAAGQVQFTIGGYLTAGGAQVQTSTNLADAEWAPAGSFPAGTNTVIFRAFLPLQDAPIFFRVQNSGA